MSYVDYLLYCMKCFQMMFIIIVAFLENATIGYSLESLCVCVRPSLCVCVCFCTITQKEIDLGTRNRNTLLYMKIAVLEQARMLKLGRYVLLGVINTIYKHCHAWVILWNAAEGSIFWTMDSISLLWNMS